MDTGRSLLFGVLALQADALSREHFVEGCALWASHKETRRIPAATAPPPEGGAPGGPPRRPWWRFWG